jgi:mono/diheme cytochrome c family protein
LRLVVKFVVLLVVVAVVVVGGGLAYLFMRYPDVGPAPDVKIDVTPERVARGEYLARHVTGCLDCHSIRDFSKFAGPITPGTLGQGGERFDRNSAGVPGVLFPGNITPAGVGHWSDGELLRAMAAGVARDGRPLFPMMPYPNFGKLAREDAYAILAYVRALKPIENPVPASSLDFPLNLIVRTIPREAAFSPTPSSTDRVAYGGYLTSAAGCSDCHTPIDDRGQPLPGMSFAGGQEFRLPPSNYRVRTANVTPDADTGIGAWTEQQFIDKFKGFETPDDRVLTDAEQRQNTAMPWTMFAGMTREDLGAIYAYLRTIKPVVHRVDRHPDTPMTGSH